MRTYKLSLEDIRQWVLNDEGLYNWWLSEGGGERPQKGGGIYDFIRRNRTELEQSIQNVLNRKPR